MNGNLPDPPYVPSPPKKVDGRVNNGGNRGGGRPHGVCEPLAQPAELVAQAAVEIILGRDVSGGEPITGRFTPSEVRRIQSLVGLTPAVFFEKMGNQFEDLLAKSIRRLEEKIDNGDGTMKDHTILIGVLTDKLRDLRGAAKPVVHSQTININGLSAADAKAFLLGGDLPPEPPRT